MHSKSIAILALSVTAAVASPFHNKRYEHEHHHHRPRPTGTGIAFPAGNDTNGLFGATGTGTGMPFSRFLTQTVSPLPVSSAANVQSVDASSSSSSCTTVSLVTETSVQLITVTGSSAVSAETEVAFSSVSAGAFYAGHSWSWGGNNGWGSSSNAPVTSAPAPSIPAVPSAPAFSASNALTTFVSMPSASRSSAVASSAAASAVASSPPSTGSSGGKRGISFNDAGLVSAFGNAVSWAYNWASTESGSLDGVEYVPMMWGTPDVSNFASQVGSATHVLSFNEPDLSSQSNIDPVTAAKLHRQGMEGLVGKVQIGSPAVTNGAGSSPPMGTTWLSQFFTACGTDCPVDFVAFHWYAGADSIEYFKSHAQDVINTAAQFGVNKVWLTEFQPTSGDAAAQAAFMQEAVAFLDSTPAVERYAAFMASDGTMLTGSSLNSIGEAYAAAS